MEASDLLILVEGIKSWQEMDRYAREDVVTILIKMGTRAGCSLDDLYSLSLHLDSYRSKSDVESLMNSIIFEVL